MVQESFYPLYLFDLQSAERELLREILRDGLRFRVFEKAALEAKAGFSLRYMLLPMRRNRRSSKNVRGIEVRKYTNARGPTVTYEKWVFLYNYVMTEFRELCVVKKLDRLQEKIAKLYDLGLQSKRYENDMHLFNQRFMSLDTRNIDIDDRYLNKVYVGFRYNSNASAIVISLLSIQATQGRYVFKAGHLDEVTERSTAGIAYELGQRLFLFGFLNRNHGAEYFALQPEGRQHNILFGFVATENREGVPHAKQCVFVEASRLYGLEEFGYDYFTRPKQTEARVQEKIGDFLSGDRVILTGDPSLPLGRYLTQEIVKPRNTLEAVQDGGPTH